jgi:hypothetical protein
MKRARPWLYFLLFIFGLAALSSFKEKLPDLYGRLALVVDGIWLAGIIALSAITLHQFASRTGSRGPRSFGIVALPLPRRWKRWISDDRAE